MAKICYEDRCFEALYRLQKELPKPRGTAISKPELRRKKILTRAKEMLLKDPQLRQRICSGLHGVSNNLDDILKALLVVLGARALLVGIDPTSIAALAIVIAKYGIGYFCPKDKVK